MSSRSRGRVAAARQQKAPSPTLNPPITPPVSSGGTDDADIFSWMFTNPELFPVRSYFPGMSPDDDLDIVTPPLSPLAVNDKKVAANEMVIERRVSLDEDDDDDDDEESSDSNGGRRSATPSIGTQLATPRQGGRNARNAADQADNTAMGDAAATDADDPRKKRLEKNREIARNCRKRKREKMKSLEEEVEKLQEWNRQLEDKLKRVPETEAREEIRKREIQEIASMVTTSSFSNEEMSKKLHLYKEVYSDFGRDRKQAINFHVEQLKALLLPNQVSKMTLWCLQQNDEFYDEQRNKATFGGGIWNMLTDALNLTEDQKRTLLSMRSEIRDQSQSVWECLRTLKDLESKITANVTSMGKQMSKIMELTAPPQQARFLLWIEENQEAVKILNNIWERKEKQLASIARAHITNGTPGATDLPNGSSVPGTATGSNT